MTKILTFHRYEGASEFDNGIRMDRDLLQANTSSMSISELITRFEQFINGGNASKAMYPWADRFVMGFPLPVFQRPPVWTRAQKVRFIESVWAGIDLGSYMVNDQFEIIHGPAGDTYREFSDALLDGQQRLSAIEDYILSGFAVADSQGVPRFWSDLPKVERRRFASYTFSRACIKTWDEGALRKAYDLRAFGGTAHTEDQRASDFRTGK